MFLPCQRGCATRADHNTAEVAELADALASGASGRKPIGVRVPASAPILAAAQSWCLNRVLKAIKSFSASAPTGRRRFT